MTFLQGYRLGGADNPFVLLKQSQLLGMKVVGEWSCFKFSCVLRLMLCTLNY